MSRAPIHLLLAAAALAATAPAQNLWAKARHGRALIADLRANHVGDILTIDIREQHRVKNEDKVDRSNSTSLAARLEAYTLSDRTFEQNQLPRLDIRQERALKGQAKQEADSSVTAKIAVIVVDVQPNGNLVVAGSRVVEVDDERKSLRISGIVRPLDISTDNTISSAQVADARISILSEGAHKKVTTRGPVAALFDTLIWAAWPF